MEQYLNLVWKNYTTSTSQNSDDEDYSNDLDDGNDLHYKVPFWIGVIVISLLSFLAVIAAIRYCYYTLCSSHNEPEKVTLVPPKSPCLSSGGANTMQRRQMNMTTMHHHSLPSDDNVTPSSSPGDSSGRRSHMSIIPVVRQHSRPHMTPTHTLTRRHHTDPDTCDDPNDMDTHHLPSTQIPRSRAPVDFRKKIHGIYVLPVSPALSSASASSSTTNSDDMIKNATNTMPVRSIRNVSSTATIHNDSFCHGGIKNASFADSPQPKDRTLPRSQGGTLRRVQPPSQPPPLPPAIPQLHFNDARPSFDDNDGEQSFHHQTGTVDLDMNTIALRFGSQKTYGTLGRNNTKKNPPPPVPCRSQKPTVLPIGFEGLTTASNPDAIGFRMMMEHSPQEDYSEHSWPKPPESPMESSGPPRPLPPSIPYDRLHHDHLIPTVLTRTNPNNFFHQHFRHNEHTMLTESET